MNPWSKLLLFFKSNFYYFFYLGLLVFTVYFNTLGNDFVSDDWGIFKSKYTFQTIFPDLSALFSNYPEQIYRALLINFKLISPLFFRLPNILSHLGSVYLIFIIISYLHNKKTAFLTASLFAVHPILIESVSWISGGSYSKSAFFFLLSFLLYILSAKNKKFYCFSIFSFYISLLFGEKIIPLFFIFPLYEICFGNFKKNYLKTLPFLLLSSVRLLLLLPGLSVRQEVLQVQFSQPKVFYNPLLQIPIALTSYWELIFYPNQLTLYHSELSFTTAAYFTRLTFLIFYLTILFWSFLKNKFLFFWFSFFIISLLVTLNPFGVSWIVAERYTYLGSLGILTGFAYLFSKISDYQKWKSLVFGIFALIIISLSLRTVIRNYDWQNEDHLWLSAALTSPSSPQNHNNLGDLYGRKGDFTRTVREFEIAIKLNPSYADAYHNLGNTYFNMGSYRNAETNFLKALKYNPHLWQSTQNLVIIYLNEKNYPQAKFYFNLLKKQFPQNPNLKILEKQLK